MATWEVRHVVSKRVIAQHGTKKAAAAQAKEMTDAHQMIDAKHEGVPVTFDVVKVDEESGA